MAIAAAASFDVKLLCVDAMFTIFRPKDTGRVEMLCNIYRDVGSLSSRLSNEELWETVLQAKHDMREHKDEEHYWLYVNTLVFRRLADYSSVYTADGVQVSPLAAHGSCHLVTSEPGLYKPDEQIMRLVRILRAHDVRIVIASNQMEQALRTLLKVHGLEDDFDAVYTSEALRTRKPYSDFWEKSWSANATLRPISCMSGTLPTRTLGLRAWVSARFCGTQKATLPTLWTRRRVRSCRIQTWKMKTLKG